MRKQLQCMGICLLAMLLLAGCATDGERASKESQKDQGQQAEQPSDANQSTASPLPKQYDSVPVMQIDPAKSYQAVVETSMGSFTIELFAKDAPITVNSFVFLAKDRYFEGITFHRVVPDFVIQGGDPTGTGAGGPGYEFEDELNSPHTYEPGIVAMANAGPNTNGSQFFVCTGEQSKVLNNYPNYTIFGKVISGMDTVLAIGNTPVTGEVPNEKITIHGVEIIEQ